MSQSQMIQAGVQVEAGRELVKIVQPLIQRSMQRLRNRQTAENVPASPQPKVTTQRPAEGNLGHTQVQHS